MSENSNGAQCIMQLNQIVLTFHNTAAEAPNLDLGGQRFHFLTSPKRAKKGKGSLQRTFILAVPIHLLFLFTNIFLKFKKQTLKYKITNVKKREESNRTG